MSCFRIAPSAVNKLLAVKLFTNVDLFYYVGQDLTCYSGQIEIKEMIKNILKRQVFFLFSCVLKLFLVRRPSLHFLCNMVCRYAWIHNIHYAHTLECDKWLHDGWILSQTFVWVLTSTRCSFWWLFSKPSQPNTLFQGVLPLYLLPSSCNLFVF